MEKLTGKELEAAIEDRKAARELAIDDAMKGNGICGAMFTLEAIARAAGLGFIATTSQDYSDDDDEVRPY